MELHRHVPECLRHRFCNAIHDGALFRATHHALNFQIKPNVSSCKGANGMRSQFARAGFNKPFDNAATINFTGNNLIQMVFHGIKIGYRRKWNT